MMQVLYSQPIHILALKSSFNIILKIMFKENSDQLRYPTFQNTLWC